MASIAFTGIASGLDTDSLISAMLIPYQNKIDVQTSKQTKLEWKQEIWKDVNNKINTFNTKYIDKLKLNSTFNKSKVTSSDSSAVQIDSTSSIPTGVHRVEVSQLATPASVTGTINSTSSGKLANDTKLSELGITSVASFKIGENTVTVGADDTLTTLQKKMKEADKKGELNISVDAANSRVFISTKQTGKESKINISADAGTQGATLLGALGINNISKEGKDAIYKYNGETYTSSSNDVTINGIKMTFVGTTTSEMTFSAKKDTDSIVDFVNEFVEAYNTLISDLNSLYDASSTSKIDALTDTQKESMSDKEIEEYEKTIKDGLLSRDSNLKNLINTLRSSLQGSVENNEFGSLAGIGITTGQWSEKGKLYVDEDTLRAAIEKNSDAVIEIFTKSGEKTTNADGTTSTSYEKAGIGTKLAQAMNSLSKRVDGVKSYQSYYGDVILTSNIKSVKEKINSYQDRYDAMLKIYQAKFTAMETALSSLNSQGSTLSSYLS